LFSLFSIVPFGVERLARRVSCIVSEPTTTLCLRRCGSRGGYYELINLDKDVRVQVNKLISACLCSTAWGQAVMGAIINPPKPGEPSYELYHNERSAVFDRLREKAQLVSQLFNSVEGVQCNTVMG
jgi:alanine transaminase